jgi:hypothetical protein
MARAKVVESKLASAVRPWFEKLEFRRLLAASVYVGENLASDFTITNDTAPAGLSNGDTVTWNPSGTQHPQGAVPGLIFGTDAFTTLSGAVTGADGLGETLLVTADQLHRAFDHRPRTAIVRHEVDPSQTGQRLCGAGDSGRNG